MGTITGAQTTTGVNSIIFGNITPPSGIYVSPTGNDSTGAGTYASPWLTLTKALTTAIAGITIYMRGGTYNYSATQNINISGSVGNTITIKNYPGEVPIISGFTTLTSWTNEGGGIYSKTISCESTPELLLIDGVNYGMGRFPKAGSYLLVDSHTGVTQITDADLNSAVTNWTGAEIVIRKNGYSLDKGLITNHSTSTLTFTNITSSQEPTNGYYYFIQKDLRTLTQFGEWYYGSGKMYVYFGTDPSAYIIKMPIIDKLIYNNGYNYVDIDGISLEGANTNAIEYLVTADSNLGNISNCTISHCGDNGIYYMGAFGLINNNTINHINQTAIYIGRWNNTITKNTIKNCGLIEGAGISGSKYNGIEISDHDNTVQYNSIDSTGYNGIIFGGANTVIKNNLITNFMLNLNDGGGIYTTNGPVSGRVIDGNIISNGIGKSPIPSDPNSQAMGIYCDSDSNDVEITNNTVFNCFGYGIMISNNTYDTISGNLCYDNEASMYMLEWATGALNNITMTDNKFVAKTATQSMLLLQSNVSVIVPFGIANNNYYARPMASTEVVYSYEAQVDSGWVSRTLSQWRTYSGQDANSKASPGTVATVNDILFDCNESAGNIVVSGLTGYKDLDGVTTTGYTLTPYTSIILLKY